MELILDSAASLDQLRHRGGKFRRIRLAGPLADEAAERALNRAYFACGCEQAALAVMAVLAASAVLALSQGFDGPFAWWRILAYLAAAAIFGKAAGHALARLRLRQLRRRLHARACVRSTTSAPGERTDAG